MCHEAATSWRQTHILSRYACQERWQHHQCSGVLRARVTEHRQAGGGGGWGVCSHAQAGTHLHSIASGFPFTNLALTSTVAISPSSSIIYKPVISPSEFSASNTVGCWKLKEAACSLAVNYTGQGAYWHGSCSTGGRTKICTTGTACMMCCMKADTLLEQAYLHHWSHHGIE